MLHLVLQLLELPGVEDEYSENIIIKRFISIPRFMDTISEISEDAPGFVPNYTH